MVNMRTTLSGADTVHERYLLHSILRWSDTYGPAVGCSTVYFVKAVHLRISFKVLFGKNFTIKLHFAVCRSADVRVPHSLLKNLVDGVVHFRHLETSPIWGESYSHGRCSTCMFFDFWRFTNGHVSGPLLGVRLLCFVVFDRD